LSPLVACINQSTAWLSAEPDARRGKYQSSMAGKMGKMIENPTRSIKTVSQTIPTARFEEVALSID